MFVQHQRFVFSALAMAPGAALLLAPPALTAGLAQAVGYAGLLGSIALLSAFTVHIGSWPRGPRRTQTLPPAAPTESTAQLLLPQAHRRPPPGFPDIDSQRAHVTTRLVRRNWPDAKPYGRDEPDRSDFALATVIGHVVDLWQVPRAEALSDAQVRELYMLDRLASADPAEAGRLAQDFQNPALVLDIRDQIAALARRRATFERACDAFEATQALFEAETQPQDLRHAMTELTAPDPELWHHVILTHDTRDPVQRDAALWCICQAECHRATVAKWFFDLVTTGTLEIAAQRHDLSYLNTVRGVVADWNADVYTADEIGLLPEDMLAGTAMDIARRLDRVADAAGSPRWDMPLAMFERYPGRPARPRPAWDLAAGCLIAPPEPADYIGPF